MYNQIIPKQKNNNNRNIFQLKIKYIFLVNFLKRYIFLIFLFTRIYNLKSKGNKGYHINYMLFSKLKKINKNFNYIAHKDKIIIIYFLHI